MTEPLSRQPHLLHVTTVPMSLVFLVGQVGYMKRRGFVVSALTSPGEYAAEFSSREGIEVHTVAMPRRITPIRDALAAIRIGRKIRTLRPDIVHAHTPKGGLLGMIGAWLARVPARIYHIHGFPFMTASGMRGRLLRWTERLSCALAHRVLCVSHSVRQVAIDEGICPAEKIHVVLGGSINGVDSGGRFNPAKLEDDIRRTTRERLGIPAGAVVIGYVGRIVRDKGLVELCEAWRRLRAEFPQLHLITVGPREPQDPVPAWVAELLDTDPRIHDIGMDWDTPPYYRAMDLVVLPSYREGFPIVPLEAAAMRLPVVATHVPGCKDAVVDGGTGLLVPPRESGALAAAIRRYIVDPELRREHGNAGRQRVEHEFRQDRIWDAVACEYASILNPKASPEVVESGIPSPMR
jgi:glycosyltransferase involved in cell wall biosynthesis